MKQNEVEALRREVRKHGKRRGKRYPAGLKVRLVTHALRRRADGVPLAMIGEELGLAYETVRRWCMDAEPGSAPVKSRSAVVPVEVVVERRSSLAVVSPSGFRLEGLDVAEAVAVLRALR